MAIERSTVVGVFERRDQAERAYEALISAGFRDDQIGLAVRGQEASNVAGRSAEETAGDAGGAAVTGAVVGGALGAVAALAIPGIGPVFALGTLGTALAGAAVGAGLGALAGGLIGMGVPEDEARYYDDEFRAGRTIVTVNAGSRYNDAQNVLRREGAYDVETRGLGGRTMVEPARRVDVRDAEPMGHGQIGTTSMGSMGTAATARWEDVMPRYRTSWERRFGMQGGSWEQSEPYYRYGWEMRSRPENRYRSWAEVESDLRRDWESTHHDTPWERAADAIRDAWENVTETVTGRR
jgi:hypothetical protein